MHDIYLFILKMSLGNKKTKYKSLLYNFDVSYYYRYWNKAWCTFNLRFLNAHRIILCPSRNEQPIAESISYSKLFIVRKRANSNSRVLIGCSLLNAHRIITCSPRKQRLIIFMVWSVKAYWIVTWVSCSFNIQVFNLWKVNFKAFSIDRINYLFFNLKLRDNRPTFLSVHVCLALFGLWSFPKL